MGPALTLYSSRFRQYLHSRKPLRPLRVFSADVDDIVSWLPGDFRHNPRYWRNGGMNDTILKLLSYEINLWVLEKQVSNEACLAELQ